MKWLEKLVDEAVEEALQDSQLTATNVTWSGALAQEEMKARIANMNANTELMRAQAKLASAEAERISASLKGAKAKK